MLLQSLAAAYGARSACVVLSGAGADGNAGLIAIKDAAGLVIVQDPAEAAYEGMPRSAIATGRSDSVLPVASIPAALTRWRREEAARNVGALTPRQRQVAGAGRGRASEQDHRGRSRDQPAHGGEPPGLDHAQDGRTWLPALARLALAATWDAEADVSEEAQAS